MVHLTNNLKKIFPRCVTIATFFSLFCTPQEPMSPFNHIESGRIRPVGMVILPYPEGAPGDTLRVGAHFAGKPIVGVMDFRVCKGEFDTVGSPMAIDGPDLALPDSIGFSYVLPETMLDSVIKYLQSTPEYSPEMAPLVSALKTNDAAALNGLNSSTAAAVVAFLSNLNLKCRFMFTVTSADGEALKVRKDFMVRYNCRFQDAPALAQRLPLNHNPVLRFVALYKVRGDTSGFDPNDPQRSFSMKYLQTTIPGTESSDTIEIDTGYSYFLGTDTGIVAYQGDSGKIISDTTVDRYLIPYTVKGDAQKARDTIIPEKFSYDWFFEQYGGSSSSSKDAMSLEESEYNSVIKLYPPLDPGVSGCAIWVKVVDYLDSKAPRPTGLARICVKCVFRYTEAYKKANGE
jgi:hypothetical protein